MTTKNLSLIAVAYASLIACTNGDNARATRPPRPDEIPTSISVAGGHLSSGLAIGEMRTDVNVDPFRIGKNPVTVGFYRDCVAAGGCSEPGASQCGSSRNGFGLHQSTYAIGGGEQLPMTCVTPKQAQAYCAWVGGQLPTAEQWELAARGELPHRYPWGEKAATCDQRADAKGTNLKAACCAATADCSEVGVYAVGKHPAGTSGAGMEDVLLAGSEILASSPTSQFSACADSSHLCAVTGMGGGAIDGFRVLESTAEDDGGAGHALSDTTFRCSWDAQ